MKFLVSKRARAHLERSQAWWIANRDARALLLEELGAAEQDIRANPHIGVIYATHEGGDVRRILLPKTKHHLYYRYRADRDEVTVLAIWGAPRSRGPKL